MRIHRDSNGYHISKLTRISRQENLVPNPAPANLVSGKSCAKIQEQVLDTLITVVFSIIMLKKFISKL